MLRAGTFVVAVHLASQLICNAGGRTHSGFEGAHAELHHDGMEDDERVMGSESEKIAMTEDCSSSSAECVFIISPDFVSRGSLIRK